ncbi:methyltransferase domain-containing protein [Actinomadura harenae]|uniref:Protein-L-isoaspartate O-methyltransferase n=1 Tax=Actinomadura harenae TaxID=2483351 RepID=A0A3M2LU66_9ACTN|nr:methyltransferase domain-containing protein [Actinomadura harenae]RMI41019.1 methyltransferase domain-containing protein [Actinomadura harenae]
MSRVDDGVERLADVLEAGGELTDRSWRRTMRAVPRHLFVPDRGYALPCRVADGPPARPIDRVGDPDGWWDAVYSNMAVITQRDDGASDPASAQGDPSSSNSAPGVVLPFLELLALREGERVLDVGTGTGWTAALLAERVGAGNVVSVEIDPEVAARAAANLQAAGYSPTLVVGDGSEGWPQGAPYDAIHVTAGVRDIPPAWLKQLRPGGRVVMPWMPEGIGGYRLRLTVTPEGHGVGTFHGRAGYMMLRSQRSSPIWAAHHRDDARVTTTHQDPARIADAGEGAELALVMHVPDLFLLYSPNADGTTSYLAAEASDPRGSWASCEPGPTGEHTVTQYGERRLWDEVERAFAWWSGQGSPGPDRFRLLVTDQETRLCLGDDPAMGVPLR